MKKPNMISTRFTRALRYRKWSILLFPLVALPAALTARFLTGSWAWRDPVSLIIFWYFGVMICVILTFMVRDHYKDHDEQ